MAGPTAAEQALKDGDPQIAIKHLQAQIRKQPADAKLRVFLFQLLCVQGDWSRALNQLTVACELDISTLPMVQTYRETIQCERLREQVFKGGFGRHAAPPLSIGHAVEAGNGLVSVGEGQFHYTSFI